MVRGWMSLFWEFHRNLAAQKQIMQMWSLKFVVCMFLWSPPLLSNIWRPICVGVTARKLRVSCEVPCGLQADGAVQTYADFLFCGITHRAAVVLMLMHHTVGVLSLEWEETRSNSSAKHLQVGGRLWSTGVNVCHRWNYQPGCFPLKNSVLHNDYDITGLRISKTSFIGLENVYQTRTSYIIGCKRLEPTNGFRRKVRENMNV